MFNAKGAKKSFDPELINLIKNGDYEQVLSIIKGYPVSKLVNSNRTHLLHVAAEYNNVDLINFLIETGCKPNVEDSSKMTPMLTAVIHKNFEAAKILHIAHIESMDRQLNHLKVTLEHFKINLAKDLVLKMRNNQLRSELIGETLAKITDLTLSDVVKFHDAVITEAFLQASPRINIFVDYWRFNVVIPTLDLQHVLVLLYHDRTKDSICMKWFCENLIDNIQRYHETRSGREFLERVFSLEVFREKNLRELEKVLKNSKRKDIETFLKYNFHIAAKAEYGRDLLACLFANHDPKVISLLKYDDIDVNGRGYDENTALHFAARNHSFDNIQLLLDRGANPNTLNERRQLPLWLALCANNSIRKDKCIKILLQSGASFPLINDRFMNDSYHYLMDVFPLAAMNILRVIIAQLVIDEACGRQVEQTIDIFMKWRGPALEQIFRHCRQQLNELKAHDIRKRWDAMTCKNEVTVFTILAEKTEKIARSIRKEELQAVLTFIGVNEETLIFYYRDLLKKRVEDIANLNYCRSRAIQFVCHFTGIRDPRNLIVEKIVDYFSIVDLRKFSTVCENRKLPLRTKTKHWFKLTKQSVFKL